MPGRILTRLEPRTIPTLAGRLHEGSAVISATNGKTTTTAMAATILRRHGTRPVHNRTGANMAGGIAVALADAARLGGRSIDGDLGLFEVDELWVPRLTEELDARVLLLGNLFRDQLDRCGELDTIIERWSALVARRAGRTRLVACADDPLVAAAVEAAPAPLYFGIDDDRLSRPPIPGTGDGKHCRRCGAPHRYTVTYLAHMGHWHCTGCSERRPKPQVVATDVELHGIRSATFTLQTPAGTTTVALPLPGLYNVYNALGAAALCLRLGVDLPTVAEGLARAIPAFGRAETFDVHGRLLSLLLIKNPAGADEVLRTLSLEDERLDLLGVLNDRVADGHDVSWIWDVDWEMLAPRVRAVTCSGTRAADLAVRLQHAGVEAHRIHLVEDLESGLDAALDRSGGPLHILPTYTAMLDLRDILSSRGHVGAYWT